MQKAPMNFFDIIDKADAEQGDIDERLADMNEASANGFKICRNVLSDRNCPYLYGGGKVLRKRRRKKIVS